MIGRAHERTLVALGISAALLVGFAVIGAAPVGADAAAGEAVDDSSDVGVSLQQAASFDARISSGQNHWQGQELFFNGTAIVEAEIGEPVRDATPSQRTFELRTVEDGRVDDLVTQFVVDRNGHRILNVTDVSGRLVIVYQGDVVSVADGVGRNEGAIGSGSVPESQWEVTPQRLSVAFEDGTVRRGTREDVTIESNRGSYFVRISSPTLDDDALAALFGSRVVERNTRENYVVVRGQDSETLTLRPSSAVPYGTHEFRFRVNDSLASTTATLEVVPSRRTTARPSPETPTPGTSTTDVTTEATTSAAPTTAPTTSESPTQSGTTTTPAPTSTEPVTYVEGTTTGSGPGFGVVATVLALLGSALLARRR